VKLIDKAGRAVVYTDFEDVIGDESSIEMPGFGIGVDLDRFRLKVRQFLKEHEDAPAIHKLCFNESLSADDVEALEQMLIKAGTGTPAEIEEAKAMSDGLGLFIRSLVGLDREAAKKAFDGFLSTKTLTANQIEFVNLVIDHLTQTGWLDPSRLYETPFIDFSARGVEGVFGQEQVSQLISILDGVKQRASFSLQ
jgi:type I restriction enzyme R subunit